MGVRAATPSPSAVTTTPEPLAGASESVLDSLASALQLDEAEGDHLFALARESGAPSTRRRRPAATSVRPALQQVLDAITDAPAWIRNGRHDIRP